MTTGLALCKAKSQAARQGQQGCAQGGGTMAGPASQGHRPLLVTTAGT